jgi:exonuclease III
MNLNSLAWNIRGITSSTISLANRFDQYNSDIVIVSEHKFKPNSLMYMNSIDSRYTSVSKYDRLASD